MTMNNSSSPLCLVATFEVQKQQVTDGACEYALDQTRKKHPYLGICIDKSTSSLQPSCHEHIPVSKEEVTSDSKELMRERVRAQLVAGVCITETMVRVHIITSPSFHYVLFLGDHSAFDGRSFVFWVGDFLVALNDYSNGNPKATAEMQPFLDWSTQLPEFSFEPYAPTTSSLALTPTAGASAPAADCPFVEDLVVSIEREVFVALKAKAKAQGSTLNGPLMAAFAVAVAEAARRQRAVGEEEEASAVIRGICAVDVRRQCIPPMPADYISSAAGMVHVEFATSGTSVSTGASASDILWKIAADATMGLTAGIERKEAFRLKDILRRGAYVEMGPYFAVAFIWSNIGHFDSADALVSVETHLLGLGSNPLISAHCVETASLLSLTVTYSPVFHQRGTMEFVAQRFAELTSDMATA